ncbi:MAG: transposase, partial [Rudanella sp.]|nr:transposase [Rudanella sp.]
MVDLQSAPNGMVDLQSAPNGMVDLQSALNGMVDLQSALKNLYISRRITNLPYIPMEYARRLPHIQPPEATFFVTIRLHGSIPNHVIASIQAEHHERIREYEGNQAAIYTQRKRHFAAFDNALDTPHNGPYWLNKPDIAKIMIDSLHFLASDAVTLIAFCVMSNHVHIVLDKNELSIPLQTLLQRFKRFTARNANILLNREGSFWQAESYDHVVRNNTELKRIIHYTLNNPVKAGLVETWEEWPYSFVNEDFL